MEAPMQCGVEWLRNISHNLLCRAAPWRPIYSSLMSICHPFVCSALLRVLFSTFERKKASTPPLFLMESFIRHSVSSGSALTILPDLNFHIAKVPSSPFPQQKVVFLCGRNAGFFVCLLSAWFPLNRIKFARRPPRERPPAEEDVLRPMAMC